MFQPTSQVNRKVDFANKMARAKAAMLAKEQQHNPAIVSVPEIIITPSLDRIDESDEEKP